MTTIVTRSGKGAPLTNAEMDSNLTNLNTYKFEIIASVLDNATDLNTVVAPGLYEQPVSSNATTALNYPVATQAGVLRVEAFPGDINNVWQQYTTYAGTGDIVLQRRTWQRAYFNGTWSTWIKCSRVAGFDNTFASAANTSITKAHVGTFVRLSGNGTIATVDATSTFNTGDTLTFFCASTTGQTVSVAINASDTFDGVAGTSITLRPGDVLALVKVAGSTAWGVKTNTSAYLRLAGGTMTGLLTLSGQPTAALHAVPRSYVDNTRVRGAVSNLSGSRTSVMVASYAASNFLLVGAAQGDLVFKIGASLSINLDNQGANGRDQVGTFSNTYVYTYAIWGATVNAGDVAGIASANATAPTLPTGYTHYVQLGVLRIDSSPQIYPFYQNGDNINYGSGGFLISTTTMAGNATYNLSISNGTPSIARTVDLSLIFAGTAATNGAHVLEIELQDANNGMPLGVYLDQGTGGISANVARTTLWHLPYIFASGIAIRTTNNCIWATMAHFTRVISFTIYRGAI